VQRILRETAEDWSITVGELCGPWRKRPVAEARRHAAKELRKLGLQLKEIGQVLGQRDHSTVINLLNGPKERIVNARTAPGESLTEKPS